MHIPQSRLKIYRRNAFEKMKIDHKQEKKNNQQLILIMTEQCIYRRNVFDKMKRAKASG